MSDNCPFCGAKRRSYGGGWVCGTADADINGEYATGLKCDATYFRGALIKSQDRVRELRKQSRELKQLLCRIHELVEDDIRAGIVRGDLSLWTIEAETRQFHPNADPECEGAQEREGE